MSVWHVHAESGTEQVGRNPSSLLPPPRPPSPLLPQDRRFQPQHPAATQLFLSLKRGRGSSCREMGDPILRLHFCTSFFCTRFIYPGMKLMRRY